MMQRLLFPVLFLLSFSLKADYIRPSLNELILKADRILYGHIVCVDEEIIEVRVQSSINYKQESVSISKFGAWACGKRWTDYQPGQTSLFFLQHKNGSYRPMGGGNEGEIPIHGEEVYLHASTLAGMGPVNAFERSGKTREDDGYNNPYNGYVIDFNEVWETTKIIRKCFRSGVTTTGRLTNIEQLCDTGDYPSTGVHSKLLNRALAELNN